MGDWAGSGRGWNVPKEAESGGGKRKTFRLWIKPEGSSEVTLLDDDPFCIYEHTLKLGPKEFVQVTCLQGVEELCPACEMEKGYRYYIGYLSALEWREWKSKKDGKIHKFSKVLVPLKVPTLKMLAHIREKRGTLRHARFELFRSDERAAAVGNNWQFSEFQDPAKLFPDVKPSVWEPYDYATLLKPKSIGEIQRLVSGQREAAEDEADDDPMGAEAEAPQSDDIPF